MFEKFVRVSAKSICMKLVANITQYDRKLFFNNEVIHVKVLAVLVTGYSRRFMEIS